jgi:hypothetical protein
LAGVKETCKRELVGLSDPVNERLNCPTIAVHPVRKKFVLNFIVSVTSPCRIGATKIQYVVDKSISGKGDGTSYYSIPLLFQVIHAELTFSRSRRGSKQLQIN